MVALNDGDPRLALPSSTERTDPTMNYYCLDCLKRFHMDEGLSDIASCPFCSSEDIEPDVDNRAESEEEETFDEDDPVDADEDGLAGDNGFDNDYDDDDVDFDDDDEDDEDLP
ncbi:MAG: hypothetical protein ACE5FC_03135 [Myxococcota bacterium]